LVKLLSKLPQSSTRTYYLQKVAEQLSKGQARLAIQFEQDLRNQVKGFRWHGRSKKFEQPNEVSRREKNESEIIFIICIAQILGFLFVMNFSKEKLMVLILVIYKVYGKLFQKLNKII